MALLVSAQSISKSYGVAPLFTNISFGIYAGDRLGLIGPNGCGKSTLLKILMGIESPDDGKVTSNRREHLVYLPQEDNFNSKNSIKNVLFGSNSEKLSEAECQRLIWEATGEKIFMDFQQTAGTLSGGWRKRLAIVHALLQKPDLLLMDEPTNHLDLEGILWLENLLKSASFSFVVVSHDRYFLENTVSSMMELNRAYLEGYLKNIGNYTDFVQNRDEVFAAQQQREQTLSNKMRREQEWLQRGPKARTTKAQFRIENAEKLRGDLKRVKVSNAQHKTAHIDFDASGRKTKILLDAHQIQASRNGKILFAGLDLKLTPGLCLGLMGQNGSGKSTLLSLLKGDLAPDSGSIERADNLRIVTFDQKREQLNQKQTLWQALAPNGDSVLYKGQLIHVAAWASRFLFANDQLHQSVSRLSGGEQARVYIANLMLESADILLLDEPTNDLDIPTLEILENSLSEFPGAIILVTHDRFLLERLSDQLLYLNGQGKTEYFSDYRQWRQALDSQQKAPIPSKNVPAKKLPYEEQKELSRLPGKIQKAETELQNLETQLSDPSVMADKKRLTDLIQKVESAKLNLESLYHRWQKLEN